MKKVGIMTFHYSDNFGAVLQTFALHHFISSLPDCQVEIIPYCRSKYNTIKSSSKVETELKVQKQKKLREFLISNCNLEIEDTEDIGKFLYFDCYIAGSDQVWNTGFAKFDDNYFLSFAPDRAKKISYAASIGMDIKKDDRFQKKYFEKYLPQFDMLSVRENEHIEFVKKYSNKECVLVLDPTFLIDRSVYENFVVDKPQKEKFILLLWLEHDSTMFRGIDFANLLALKFGYGIYHSFPDMPDRLIMNSLGSIYYEGVEDFLWFVKNADMIITNSFHAVVFSIIFKRPFYAFYVDSMRSRIENLRYMLSIDDRCIENFCSLNDVNFEIDYEKIDKQIEKYRKTSVDFLKKALEN